MTPTPKERPILFSAPMVRAILVGTKTQTRQMVKPQPEEVRIQGGDWLANDGRILRCPFGSPGDRLWVREAFQRILKVRVDASGGPVGPPLPDEIRYKATDNFRENVVESRWRSSIHMPRWASRITLEITDVRVERAQDISEADAKAEGAFAIPHSKELDAKAAAIAGGWKSVTRIDSRHLFAALWESIHGEGAWERNDLVWCIAFRRMA